MVIYCTRNKKLYASKEVKEFPKMLKRSNSARDKNHRKSNAGMRKKHMGLMTSESAKITFALSKTRILNSILHL